MPLMIEVPTQELAEFCRRNHIRRLRAFGSVLREDFTPDSDVDLIVEFEPGVRMGLISLMGLQRHLGGLLGREVDLNTPDMLSKYFRDRALAQAEVLYERT